MTPRPRRRAAPGATVLGGTFDRLHVGHHALLAAAFRAGGTVGIGVTTDRFLADHPKPSGGTIQPFRTRWRALERYLLRTYRGRRYRLTPLDDPLGRSVEPGVARLVVSTDTLRGGARVNAERRRSGLPSVTLVRVPSVLAQDGFPVSSRRIRSGAIDRLGRRRRPLGLRLVLVSGRLSSVGARAWAAASFSGLPTRVRVSRVQLAPGRPLAPVARRARRPGDEVVIALAGPRGGRWSVALLGPGELQVAHRRLGATPGGAPAALRGPWRRPRPVGPAAGKRREGLLAVP